MVLPIHDSIALKIDIDIEGNFRPLLPGQKIKIMDLWCRKTGLRSDGTARPECEANAATYRERFTREGPGMLEYGDWGSVAEVEVIEGPYDGFTGILHLSSAGILQSEVL